MILEPRGKINLASERHNKPTMWSSWVRILEFSDAKKMLSFCFSQSESPPAVTWHHQPIRLS